MSETSLWMPLYWADYLADTTHLSTEEHGAYLLLIATYWRRARALPDDDQFLATVTKSSTKKWKILRPKISEFFSISEGLWKHGRVELEILRSSERLNSARANGRAGGLAKSKLTTTTITTTKKEQEDTPSLHSGVAREPKRKTRTSMPEGFPFQADLDWAQDYWLKKGRSDLCTLMGEEVERFHDHHNGKLTSSADWSGSWRTWARNAIKFSNGAHNGRRAPKLPTAHDNLLAGTAELIADIRAKARGPSQ